MTFAEALVQTLLITITATASVLFIGGMILFLTVELYTLVKVNSLRRHHARGKRTRR
jgi:hypothetical protein